MRKHGVQFTQQDFLDSAKEKHGDKYDYSKVVYKNALTKIIIICKDHGEFIKTPAKHVNTGQGCPVCSKDGKLEKMKLGTEVFIDRSSKVHDGFYDYSKSKYGGNDNDKVTITCAEHGDFLQTPNNHLRGSGCPKCGSIKNYMNKTKNQLTAKFKGLVQPEDYKLIPLGKGKFTKVSNEDFETFKDVNFGTSKGYATHHTLGDLHKLILKLKPPLEVDHKNRDKLDNRRGNLRPSTSSQQKCNIAKCKGSNTYKGVYWNKDKRKWKAYITLQKKGYHLGYFDNELEAVKVRDIKAVELHGEFAWLNFPELKEEYLKMLGNNENKV